MDEIDVHQLPPKNAFQKLVVFTTVGLTALTFLPTWLTHIPVPRGNISFSAIIIIAGIGCYWLAGYAPVFVSKILRQVLGIPREMVPDRQNITQKIIKKVCVVIVFFYTLGYILGASGYIKYLMSLGNITAIGWFLWWTAGETPYAVRRMTSKSRLPIRAMIFFACVIGACAFGIYFLANNPFYYLIPRYDFSFSGITDLLRNKFPVLDDFLR